MTPPSAISIDAAATPAPTALTAAGSRAEWAGAAGDGGSFSRIAGTNDGVASHDGAEPFTAARNRARQPNSCCGLSP